MVFTSREFLVFFVLSAALYFGLPYRSRWLILLAASLIFYAAGEAQYVLLLIVVSLTAYGSALLISGIIEPHRRRTFLALSLLLLFAPLVVFKYLGFLLGSAVGVSAWAGMQWSVPHLDLFLPLGISFFTFQAAAYVIDVYHRRCPVERNLGVFALFVSFFPQLIAGPIERASDLLPQLRNRVSLDAERLVSGARLILWGFFKKLVIADNLAVYVDQVYGAPTAYQGLPLIVATVFFAFQIYCDFSAYVDIARGTARILGIDLVRNFDGPYGASSIGNFWTRWHITLSKWFRDYLYIPLGGNRHGIAIQCRNILIVFLLSGLWHGAGWTFVIWGALHGTFLALSVLTRAFRDDLAARSGLSAHPYLRAAVQIAITFTLVNFTWVFFRADSVGDALYVLANMFAGLPEQIAGGGALSRLIEDARGTWPGFWMLTGAIIAIFVSHLFPAEKIGEFLHERCASWQRWAGYYAALIAILFFSATDTDAFIYFRF